MIYHSIHLTAKVFVLFFVLAAVSGCDSKSSSKDPNLPQLSEVDYFLGLTSDDGQVVKDAIEYIDQNWHPGCAVILIETNQFIRLPTTTTKIMRLLMKHGVAVPGDDHNAIFQKIWEEKYEMHPQYEDFKRKLYLVVDERFEEYFELGRESTIRWDEIRFGGVKRDQIPPLKDPIMVSAEEAEYLQETNVVFGVEVNGDARAYPKRILAWHEMVKDVIGGESMNGVYCTLCGTVIFYFADFEDKHYELGTSGFLFRSNKLMYDHETKSLWNTIVGEPVVGTLVGKGIRLKRHRVVTTTWGQWKTLHPDTKVLSIDTGHERDYSEGEAYRDYFSNDKLMFGVPDPDARLKNKDEVLCLVFDKYPEEQLAISADYLFKNRIHYDQLGEIKFVVLTDESGANRVFEQGDIKFTEWADEKSVMDENGALWTFNEDYIQNGEGAKLMRLSGHRAFWFGWHASYPETRLVK